MIRIALVGIGKIAVDQHVPAIQSSPDWDIAATVSRHGSLPGVPAFSDIDTLLAQRPDIRVISLCLPPVPRFAAAAAALQAGRHVMLEKPPGATLTECAELESLALKHGVALYATWHSREAPAVPAAQAWLADKALRRLQITWMEDVRRWHPGQEWIRQPGGLGVFDPGINALSILTAILPDPVHLIAATLEIPDNWQTPVAAQLDFHHPAGVAVSANFDFRSKADVWTIEAETDRGTLTIANGGATMTIDGVPSPTVASQEYPRLYANMSRLVASGTIDMDLAPMRHVADAFLLGRRIVVDPVEL